PQVLLERDADQVLLLGERLDLLAVLVEDRDAATEVGLPEAPPPASRAYRTAWSSTSSFGTSWTVAIVTYFRGTPCWLPRIDRSFSRAAASSFAASSFANGCQARPMRKRPLIRNAFMERRVKGPGYLRTCSGQRASAREARKCSSRSSASFLVMPLTDIRSFAVAFAEQDVAAVQEGGGVVRLHAEDQVEAVHRLLRLPAPPVSDGLADQRVHVARLDLEDVVEQGEGLRVVAARARDERAAQEARHVDADLFDLLPQVPVLRVQGGRLLVRREGLRSTAEVRQRVAFHLEGRGIVRPEPQEFPDGLEALPPAAFVGVDPHDHPVGREVPHVIPQDPLVHFQGLCLPIETREARASTEERREIRPVDIDRRLIGLEGVLVVPCGGETLGLLRAARGRLGLPDHGPLRRRSRFHGRGRGSPRRDRRGRDGNGSRGRIH